VKKPSLRSCATALAMVVIVTGLSYTPGAVVHASAGDAAVRGVDADSGADADRDAVDEAVADPLLGDPSHDTRPD